MVLLYFCDKCGCPIDLTRLKHYVATRPHFYCANCHSANESTKWLRRELAKPIEGERA